MKRKPPSCKFWKHILQMGTCPTFLKIHIGVCFIRVVSCICSETENCEQGHLSRGLFHVYRVGSILRGLGFVKYEAEYLHAQQ